MAQNLKDFLEHFDLTVWVIRFRPKYPKKSFIFRTLAALATFQLINLGLSPESAFILSTDFITSTVLVDRGLVLCDIAMASS